MICCEAYAETGKAKAAHGFGALSEIIRQVAIFQEGSQILKQRAQGNIKALCKKLDPTQTGFLLSVFHE